MDDAGIDRRAAEADDEERRKRGGVGIRGNQQGRDLAGEDARADADHIPVAHSVFLQLPMQSDSRPIHAASFFLEIRQYFCEKILLGAIISHRRSYCQSSDTPYVIFLQLSLRGGTFIRLLILLRLAVAALQRQQQLPSQQPRKALYLPRLLQIEDRVFILLLFRGDAAP